MNFLGIDVGTTGCKTALFSESGEMLSHAYQEYHHHSPQPGWAQLDAHEVWEKIKLTIQKAVSQCPGRPVKSLCISSMGEALVPVSLNREILSPSILNFDERGEEYLEDLKKAISKKDLYAASGNTLGNHFSLTKLMWIRDHQPELHERTNKFLPWAGFVAFMLGAQPTADLSLANRMLLLDVDRKQWSSDLIRAARIDRDKLPIIVAAGAVIGTVSDVLADELGLPRGVAIVSGAHDQCINAIGCGAINEGRTLLGMGTFICATAVFKKRLYPERMIDLGLNTEHHAVSEKFVTFIYNQGGSVIKWYRDTFAALEHQQSTAAGQDIYHALFNEIPDHPASLVVLPSFASTGLPDFSTHTAGAIAGLKLDTSRGEILKAIAEGIIYDLKETIDQLPSIGIQIEDLRVVGGGSKSDKWVQISADILGKPLVRPRINEAGVLGAAITAAVGCGHYSSFEEGVDEMVKLEKTFDPGQNQQAYRDYFQAYLRLKSLLKDYLVARY